MAPRHPRQPPAARTASLIAEIPHDERPRERLLRNGPQALSDAELVAVLLRGGRPGASVLELAREILEAAGSLSGLAAVGSRGLLRTRGIGEVRLATLRAAVEIGCRMASASVPDRAPLSRPTAVARYVDLRYGRCDQEVLGALFLSTRHRLIGEREIYRGALQRVTVEPRAILREALLHHAAGVVLFHTHPGGDPSPSPEDLVFTRRVSEAGQWVGIELVDHLVVGAGGRWVSLRERGGW